MSLLKRLNSILLFATLILIFKTWIFRAEAQNLPRVIITSNLNTDSGDPDDKQSMAHLFMYADEVEIVSIIPDRWDVHGIEAPLICIDAYEEDFNNHFPKNVPVTGSRRWK